MIGSKRSCFGAVLVHSGRKCRNSSYSSLTDVGLFRLLKDDEASTSRQGLVAKLRRIYPCCSFTVATRRANFVFRSFFPFVSTASSCSVTGILRVRCRPKDSVTLLLKSKR